MWQNLYYKFKSYSTSPNSYVINSGIINVLNVARPLLTALVLLNISESILGRDCINAPNVAKLLIGTQFLLHICKFILKRNLINVQNVGKAFSHSSHLTKHLRTHAGEWWNKWWKTFALNIHQETKVYTRNLWKCCNKYVEKYLIKNQIEINYRDFILEVFHQPSFLNFL